MTDPATIEKIARRHCELMGLDPDTFVMWWRGVAYPSQPKLWEVISINVREALAMSTAIKEVMKDE